MIKIKSLSFIMICVIIFITSFIFPSDNYELYKERLKNGGLLCKRIDNVNELVSGTNDSYNRIGDYIIQNNKIRIIISELNHNAGNMSSGGNIIDAVNMKDKRDQLESVFLTINDNFSRQVIYENLEIINDGLNNEEAIIRVSGYDSLNEKIIFTTDYILQPDANYVIIKTKIQNNEDKKIEGYQISDSIQWGSSIRFLPDYGNVLEMKKKYISDWIASQGAFVSYGYTTKTGNLESISGDTFTDVKVASFDLEPGKEMFLERYFIVGYGDTALISNIAYDLQKKEVGRFKVKVLELNTEKPIEKAEVKIRHGLEGKARSFSTLYTDENGVFETLLPQGSYGARVEKAFARVGPKSIESFKITPGAVVEKTIHISPPGHIKYKIVDAETNEPIPAKLTFLLLTETRGAPFPYDYKADGSSNVIYTVTGEGESEFAGGQYNIIASRGIEYEIDEKRVEIKYGETTEVEFKLERVVDTTGYISADLNVHSLYTSDSRVSIRDRIISAVGEGVELIVSADREHLTDYNDMITELGVSQYIKAVIGCEFVPSGESVFGSFTAFPFPSEKKYEELGIKTHNTNPSDLLKSVRKSLNNDGIIIVNQPRISQNLGYFEYFGYDRKKFTLEGISFDFDAIEIFRSKRIDKLQLAIQDWFALTRDRKIFTAVGSSSANNIYTTEVGYPRVYIKSSTDDPSQININEIVKAIKDKQVFITNGPFVKFKVNGNDIGSLVNNNKQKAINCDLMVLAPKWIDITTIVILKDGQFCKGISLPEKPLKDRPVVRENYKNFQLSAPNDMAITVRVLGANTLDPVISKSYGEMLGVTPVAITNPIFIDENGDGKFIPKKIEVTKEEKKPRIEIAPKPKKPTDLTKEELEKYRVKRTKKEEFGLVKPKIIEETEYKPMK